MKARSLKSIQAKTLRYEGCRRDGEDLILRASLGTTILEAPVTIGQLAEVVGVVQERFLLEAESKALRKCYPSLY